MLNKDMIKATGDVRVYKNGKLVRHVNNLVVTTGLEFIVARMKDDTADVMSHIAIGTGTAAAALGDTTLGTEVARVALATAGGVVSGNTITFEVTIPADIPDITAPATTAVTEAGIFDDDTAGTMLAHVVFGVVTKEETDVMTISWTITLA